MTNPLYFVVFVVGASLFLTANELVKRRYALPVYVSRKIAHIGGAGIGLIASGFLSRWELILLSLLFAFVLFATRRTTLFSSIQTVSRNSYGEILLPLGIALTAFLFLPDHTQAFQYGVLVMGVSDAVAGIVGERWGTHVIHLPWGRKSIEGTVGFMLSAVIITSFFTTSHDARLIGIPLILTFVELGLGLGLDNLVLPILGAYLVLHLL